MKKTGMMLAGVMMLAACSEEVLDEVTTAGQGRTVTVTATLPDVAGRLALQEGDNNAIKVDWKESGEAFTVMTTTAGESATFTQTEGDQFTGTLPGGDDYTGPYYAFYPEVKLYDEENGDYIYGYELDEKDDYGFPVWKEITTFSATEVPYTIGNVWAVQSGTLDDDYALMYGTSTDGRNFEFKHLTAIVKFTLEGMDAGIPLKWIDIKCDKDLVIMGIFDLTTGQLVKNLWEGITVQSPTLTDDGKCSFYAYLPAVEQGSMLTLKAYAGSDEKSVDYEATVQLTDKGIEPGKYYRATRTVEKKRDVKLVHTAATADELIAFQQVKDANPGEAMKLTLTADIDMKDKTWTPINKEDSGGAISIDGGGHTISNLTIDESEGNAGFISYLCGGTIENLHFRNISVKNSSGDYHTGGIVGYMNGSEPRIVGCSVSGSVESSNSSAGGIVGCMVAGKLAACLNMASVNGETSGGIIGDSDGTVIGCVNTGTVAGSSWQGAVVGYNYDNGTVTSCYWSGTDDTLKGIGYGGDSQQDTKVFDWATFDFTTLNTAISEYGYQYVLNTDEATKTNEPLKLQKLEANGN